VKEPRDPRGSQLFAPQFARTLVDLNNCLPEQISDHSPITVDLPFKEPASSTQRNAWRCQLVDPLLVFPKVLMAFEMVIIRCLPPAQIHGP